MEPVHFSIESRVRVSLFLLVCLVHWLRKLIFHFLSNSMGYDGGDIFLPILNQMEIHLAQNWKENCHHHHHISLHLKGNGIIVFLVYIHYITVHYTMVRSSNYRLPPNSTTYKTVPVILSLHPSLIFLLHLSPSLVHPTGFSFFTLSVFLVIFTLLSSNNTDRHGLSHPEFAVSNVRREYLGQSK